MSAYICTDFHVATIATAYARMVGTPEKTQAIADTLLATNIASVNYLYNEANTTHRCDITAHDADSRTPAELIAAVDCWMYQSCERPDWHADPARALGEAIKAQFAAASAITGKGTRRADNVWSINAPAPAPTPEPPAVPMAEQVARLRTEHPQLVSPETVKGGSLIAAAKNLRAQLRARWPGVKFSVRTDRYAGGSSLDVRWTDGPTVDQVDAIAKRYRAGSFDGMTDCYEFSRNAWNEAFGAAMYVFTQRDYSPAALEWAKAQFGDDDRGRYHGPAHLAALRDLAIKRIKRGA